MKSPRTFTPTSPHFFIGYSLFKLILWKIGVLRSFLRSFNNIKSTKLFLLSKQNRKFQLKYAQPAIICGTGPSLQGISKNFLKEFSNFGAIFSINHFPITKLGKAVRIDYQVLMDAYHFSEVPKDPAEKIFRGWLRCKFKGVLVTKINADIDFSGDKLELNGLCLPTFTSSIDPMGIVGYQEYSIFFALSTAIWLGYSPIFLIGIDASQHASINVNFNSVTLGKHHAYKSHVENIGWKGRPTVSSILGSNAFFIEQCELFKEHDVYIIESSSHVDTLPRVTQREALKKLKSSRIFNQKI